MITSKKIDLLIVIIVLFDLFSLTISKCVNSTEFKYDLKQPSELVNYHSFCSDYSKRTCCSANNFQTLSKRIGKVMGGNVELSNSCRNRLINSLCSPCDGDIGQNLKEGTCLGYCKQFYYDCQNDYFSFDNNHQLRVCKEDDIICSKLSDILDDKPKQDICGLIQLKIGDYNCWNGEISAYYKGNGHKKITVNSKPKARKHREAGIWQTIAEYKQVFVPLFLGLVVLLIYLIKRMRTSYSLWKRQIRNL